jgi:hypothetical protein
LDFGFAGGMSFDQALAETLLLTLALPLLGSGQFRSM